MTTQIVESVDTLALKKPLVTPGNRRPLPANVAIAADGALLLRGLSLGARNVLSELVRHIKKANPLGVVFPKKEVIAARIGISARSVYRHLNELTAADLIEREAQKHRKGTGVGEFLTGNIKLTLKGAAYLGLIPWERPALSNAPESPQERALVKATINEASRALEKASTSAYNEVIHGEPCDKSALHNKSLTEPNNTAERTAPKKTFGVPDDLQWLLSHGLNRGELFWLMSLAKASKAKHRISDIVESQRQVIETGTIKNLKAYLRTLVASDTCYRTKVSKLRANAIAQRKQAEYQREAAMFKAQFAGMMLTSKNLKTQHEIDHTGSFVRTWDGLAWSSAPLRDLRPWLAGIRSGNLVLASREIVEKGRVPDLQHAQIVASTKGREAARSAIAAIKGIMHRPGR